MPVDFSPGAFLTCLVVSLQDPSHLSLVCSLEEWHLMYCGANFDQWSGGWGWLMDKFVFYFPWMENSQRIPWDQATSLLQCWSTHYISFCWFSFLPISLPLSLTSAPGIIFPVKLLTQKPFSWALLLGKHRLFNLCVSGRYL